MCKRLSSSWIWSTYFSHNTGFVLFVVNIGVLHIVLFFFQAEDGIRDWSVTGVQTCALPISGRAAGVGLHFLDELRLEPADHLRDPVLPPLRRRHTRLAARRLVGGRGDSRRGHGQIGRASCRERVDGTGVAAHVETKYITAVL